VGVIDYDAARLQQRVIDVANGALQFSILASGKTRAMADYLDETRFKRFIRGYDEVDPVSMAELQVIPWLMVERWWPSRCCDRGDGIVWTIGGYGFCK